MVKKYESEW